MFTVATGISERNTDCLAGWSGYDLRGQRLVNHDLSQLLVDVVLLIHEDPLIRLLEGAPREFKSSTTWTPVEAISSAVDSLHKASQSLVGIDLHLSVLNQEFDDTFTPLPRGMDQAAERLGQLQHRLCFRNGQLQPCPHAPGIWRNAKLTSAFFNSSFQPWFAVALLPGVHAAQLLTTSEEPGFAEKAVTTTSPDRRPRRGCIDRPNG